MTEAHGFVGMTRFVAFLLRAGLVTLRQTFVRRRHEAIAPAGVFFADALEWEQYSGWVQPGTHGRITVVARSDFAGLLPVLRATVRGVVQVFVLCRVLTNVGILS